MRLKQKHTESTELPDNKKNTLLSATQEDYRYHKVSSSDYAPQDRIEAWRQTAFQIVDFSGIDGREDAFYGVSASIAGPTGKFGSYSGSAHSTKVRRAESIKGEWSVLMLLQEGSVELQNKAGSALRMEAGSLALFNCSAQEYFQWTDSREIHILLPRATLQRALGAGPEHFGSVTVLDGSGLAPFVRNQLILLERLAGSLEQAELAAMLDVTIEMSLMLLASVSRLAGKESSDFHPALYASALRYIETYSHKADLDVDTLARVLGCSRAKLYRIFGQQGATVSSVIRNVRLEKACRLIEKSPLDTQISTIAYACGFADPSSFGKMFKVQYGLSPREWRLHSLGISRTPLR